MRYKIGAFNDDLHSEFAVAARLAAEHGVDGLAIRNVEGRNIRDLSTAEIRSLRSTADEHGLQIASVGSPYGRGFYLDDDAAQHDAEALLERMIHFADLLGCTRIRVFALWLHGQDGLAEWTRRPDLSSVIDRVAARLAPSVELAQAAGMTLMIELEGASYVGTVGEARQLIEYVNSPVLALCWDVANGWWSGELPWTDGFELARGLPIVDVQTKDAFADANEPARLSFDQAVVGEGAVPYDRIVAALLAAGYCDYFTAERVYQPLKPEEYPRLQRDYLSDIDNLRALLERCG